ITVTSNSPSPAAACQLQSNVANATANFGLTASDNGSLTCVPALLRLAKTPDNGTFTQGAPISFTIVVSNAAAAGGSPATNVVVTDQLPTAGGLTWTVTTLSQGTCTIIAATQLLTCNLGTIAAGGSASITVTSQNPTPGAACQLQNNTANATAD